MNDLPSFAHSLPTGGEPGPEPFELDRETRDDLAAQIREIERCRAAAIGSSASYVIIGTAGGR